MKRIDLHGLRYEEAEIQLEDFILCQTPPFEIIMGNTKGMNDIVTGLLEKYDLSAFHPHANNLGSIVVTERIQ